MLSCSLLLHRVHFSLLKFSLVIRKAHSQCLSLSVLTFQGFFMPCLHPNFSMAKNNLTSVCAINSVCSYISPFLLFTPFQMILCEWVLSLCLLLPLPTVSPVLWDERIASLLSALASSAAAETPYCFWTTDCVNLKSCHFVHFRDLLSVCGLRVRLLPI